MKKLSERKVLVGRLELDITQSTCGDNVYTVELFNPSGKSLYRQLEGYLDENVKITIEKIPIINEN